MQYKQKLDEFYSLPSCDEQEAVSELIGMAMDYVAEGDLVMAGDKMKLSIEIVEDVLEGDENENEWHQV